MPTRLKIPSIIKHVECVQCRKAKISFTCNPKIYVYFPKMLKYYSLLFKQSYCICANTQSLLCIQDAEREILHLIKCLLPLGIASRVPVCKFSMSAVELALYRSRRMEKKNVTSKINNGILRRSYGVKICDSFAALIWFKC